MRHRQGFIPLATGMPYNPYPILVDDAIRVHVRCKVVDAVVEGGVAILRVQSTGSNSHSLSSSASSSGDFWPLVSFEIGEGGMCGEFMR